MKPKIKNQIKIKIKHKILKHKNNIQLIIILIIIMKEMKSIILINLKIQIKNTKRDLYQLHPQV